MPGERDRTLALERERSLRILRNSKLTIFDEFKRMLRDIQNYLEEAKRSGFGGTNKRENDMRPYLYDTGDTYEKPFFSVLMKMLLEIVSMKNAHKQLEDLQRVYQWYVTNKTQLCKPDKKFGYMQEGAKPLTYRPSSSIDPGSKPGILRHARSTKENWRSQRPQTSLERGRLSSPEMTYSAEEAMEKALLNIKGIDAVHPPDIPDDLDEYTKVSLPTQKTQQQPIKRPDTAPPYVMVDRTSRVERSLAKSKAEEYIDVDGMQSPVSKVSIRYNPPGEQGNPVQVHQHEQNSEILQVNTTARSKSANSLRQGIQIEDEKAECDLQSEIDEDRVIVDADQVVKQAEFEENRSLNGLEKSYEEVDEKFVEVDEFSHRADNCSSEEELAVGMDSEHSATNHRTNTVDGSKTVDEQANITYIPSYSKFQKLKERKKVTYNDEDERRIDNTLKTVSHSPKNFHNNVAKKQIDRHSGLNKPGLSSNAILEMVTPIGQQMLEQKAPIQISNEFRREMKQSPCSSPRSSSHDRLSPRLYLRSNAGLKSDHQRLKRAEIMFPEESPRMYKVHFPQEKSARTEKHYKVSGPVEPDSIRYQYTQDSFGNKTYLKKLTRPSNYNRADNVKTRTQLASPQAVFQNKDPRTMNTKALASSMIIKHLGATDRRSSDRMTGHSGVVPIWVASQDAENFDATNYVKMTKPLEKDASSSSGFSEVKRPKYHIRQIDVDLPGNMQSPNSSGDVRGKYGEREHGLYHQGTTPVHNTDGLHGDQIDAHRVEWLNQYNGGYFPLKAEGRAVQVGEKSTQSWKQKQSAAPQIQAKIPSTSRPSSHRTEKGRTASPVQNLSRPVSACSKASSRLGSARSKRSVRPQSRSKNNEVIDGVFDVNKFSHYCFEDNPSLEDDYQLQRKTNAAVDIQRIFRGYMARRYARDLKVAERERQKRAAVKIQSSMRGYLARKRLMEEKLKQRIPQINADEWEKQYKDHLKKKENERAMKAQARSRQFTKLQVKQDEKVRKVSASKAIYDIFHDKGPTKAQMKAAAITIQRYVRGWLVRKFYQKAKQKAMKRTLDFNGFLKSYKAHIERIMERHGVKDPQAVLAFDELLEYIETRNKYEIEYDRISNGKPKEQHRVFTYEDIKKFFAACGHHPSRKEIEDAIAIAIEDGIEIKQHHYTKAQIVEVAFQIYVPKGTKLTDTRKSTWLNPIIDGDEAAMIKLSKKINESTNLEKVFELVSATKREKVEMEQRAITPDLLPLDAKLNGFEKLNEKPTGKGSPLKKKK